MNQNFQRQNNKEIILNISEANFSLIILYEGDLL